MSTAPLTESFLTSSSNAKLFQPESTKIASRPSENVRKKNTTNNRNYISTDKTTIPNPKVVVLKFPQLLSGSQRMTRNQFQQFLAPVDPVDSKVMNPTNTFSQEVKENYGAKMKDPITGTTPSRQRKPSAEPKYIDLIDDDNAITTSGTRKMKRSGSSFIHSGNPSGSKRERSSILPVPPDWSSDVHRSYRNYLESELNILRSKWKELRDEILRLKNKRKNRK
jgi:hypothetical protein